MGYSHYWDRSKEFTPEAFALFVDDVRRLHEASKDAVPLAGWNGSGEPVIGPDSVGFNGVEACGHAHRELGITWPSEESGGVESESDPVDGTWFAGAKLKTRACGGDCSHETILIDRVEEDSGYSPGQWGGSCKTAFKPYDLMVTATLIAAKHRFGEDFSAYSDGEDKDWFDAQMLCQQVLGYGLDYNLAKLNSGRYGR